MGKSTESMFNSYVNIYQRVNPIESHLTSIVLWFSRGFHRVFGSTPGLPPLRYAHLPVWESWLGHAGQAPFHTLVPSLPPGNVVGYLGYGYGIYGSCLWICLYMVCIWHLLIKFNDVWIVFSTSIILYLRFYISCDGM